MNIEWKKLENWSMLIRKLEHAINFEAINFVCSNKFESAESLVFNPLGTGQIYFLSLLGKPTVFTNKIISRANLHYS